ncbi:unnamed protein product [marine sediment metagenome]|uniref:Uncharacterized protein n=1 Tax=marine sediment metagenome TaxID=412755 RepID=X1C7G9_9ZZZZ
MPTLFAVYNLIENKNAEEYDKYLTNTKIPGIRGAPWCTEFNTWKIDKVLAPAVSEPDGDYHRNLLICMSPRLKSLI